MRRREFIAGLGSAATWPVRAQQTPKPVIGWLHTFSPQATRDYARAFDQGLAEMGFVEGRNVAVEHRWADGDDTREPALAAELVARSVAVILADGATFALVAKGATRTIPVIFIAGSDPIPRLVASVNRPGGNLTGVAVLQSDLMPKRLELLHKLVPAAGVIAVLRGPATLEINQGWPEVFQSVASLFGVRVLILSATSESEIAAAFGTLVRQRVGALLVGPGLVFFNAREQIVSLAARHALPTNFADSASVRAGGLSSYGADQMDVWRQAGVYAGRVLKGEKPIDLPVLLPTRFELVINAKTAKALGLTIPETLLATADEVIQ
jgi:putative ABC transport system substrate-binding protein